MNALSGALPLVLHLPSAKSFILRELQLADAGACAALIPSTAQDVWTASQIKSLVDKEKSYVCVGLENETGLVAFALFMPVLDEMELLYIAVHPAHLRLGLAQTLLASVMDCAKGRLRKLHLEVRESNTAARALYERLNFKAVGKRKNYYASSPDKGGKREDALLYSIGVNSP